MPCKTSKPPTEATSWKQEGLLYMEMPPTSLRMISSGSPIWEYDEREPRNADEDDLLERMQAKLPKTV